MAQSTTIRPKQGKETIDDELDAFNVVPLAVLEKAKVLLHTSAPNVA